MSIASVALNLVSGTSQQRLRSLALDSANVKASWDALPANLQRAHRELLNLGTQQQRLGYLRHEERQSFRLHAEYVQRHQQSVQTHVAKLKSMIDTSPHLARYESLRASGGLDAAIASDQHIEQLHRAQTQMADLRRQSAVMGDSQKLMNRWGMHGDFDAGDAAGYYGRRALFGSRDGQTPRTLGQWGVDAGKGAAQKVGNTVRQVAGIFGAFSIGSFLNTSIKEFDDRTQQVQRVGARLGGAFDDVGKSLDRLRKDTAYTRREVIPAMEAITRVAGNAGLTPGGLLDQSLTFGRATGLGAGAASTFARMAMYGATSPELAWGMMYATGMRDRPEAFLGIMGAAQGSLGQGFVSVPAAEAARWAGYATDIGGEAYKNERGASLVQKLIAGSRAMPNPYAQALKFNALAKTGVYDLGGGVKADTSTTWGLEMAAASGHHNVYEREIAAVVNGFGGPNSQTARYAVQSMFPGLSPHEVELAARGKKRGVKFRDPYKAQAEAPPMSTEAQAAITPTERLNADMEATYEAAGKELLPTVHDFKRMLEEFGKGIAGQQGAIDAFKNALHHLARDAEGGALTQSVAAVLAQSMADTWLGKALAVGTLFGVGGGVTGGPNKDDAALEAWRKTMNAMGVQVP